MPKPEGLLRDKGKELLACIGHAIHHNKSGSEPQASLSGRSGAPSSDGIESTVESKSNIEQLILSWAGDFRQNELTVADIQERFALLDVNGLAVTPAIRKRILETKRELDAIRWGMCERGQHAEIERIFVELQQLFAAKA